MNLESTIVVCAHNEEDRIPESLHSILNQTVKASLIIVVADRCTDGTGKVARSLLEDTNHLIITKSESSWRNSISENLELARANAVGTGFVVVDADMVIPPCFLERLLPQLQEFASVSSMAKTDPKQGTLNRLVSLWERTYGIAPFGEQPRGGARAISKKDLDQVGGFRDVYAWESDLDTRFRKSGRRVKLDKSLSALHRRKMTLRHSVSYQILAGKARRELGVSRSRTLVHSVFRLRPFVMYGYLKGSRESPQEKS